jgi:hypothetical protein
LKELNVLFDALPKEAPSADRYRRGALKKNDGEAVSSTWSIPETKESKNAPAVIDLLDNDPVNFIDKLPKTFYADMVT